MTKIFSVLIFLGLNCWSLETYSKVIYEQYSLTPEVTIRIEGAITFKDLEDFKEAIKKLDDSMKTLHMDSVQLNSRGGSGVAGRGIGRIIRARKLNTYLAADSNCASACVDILIAGVQRYAFGNVRVHRSTFIGESYGDDEVEGFVSESQKTSEEYVRSMGISVLLADAMQSTESWRIRQLTELEKHQWQVFGTDRVTEEILFNQIARSRYISRDEFIDIFKSHYDECIDQAKDFKVTVYDCAKSLNHKPQNWLEKSVRAMNNWLNRLNGVDQIPATFLERVEYLEGKIRIGDLYQRPMLIKEIIDLKSPSSSGQTPFSKAVVDQMESTNIWWVSKNKINVLLNNPTDRPVKNVVFTLSETGCKGGGKKRAFSFDLPTPLEAQNSVIYNGELPIAYDKVYGKGQRCGLVEGAKY